LKAYAHAYIQGIASSKVTPLTLLNSKSRNGFLIGGSGETAQLETAEGKVRDRYR